MGFLIQTFMRFLLLGLGWCGFSRDQGIRKLGRSRCGQFRLCCQIALYLPVNLVRSCDILRVHFGHHELPK